MRNFVQIDQKGQKYLETKGGKKMFLRNTPEFRPKYYKNDYV